MADVIRQLSLWPDATEDVTKVERLTRSEVKPLRRKRARTPRGLPVDPIAAACVELQEEIRRMTGPWLKEEYLERESHYTLGVLRDTLRFELLTVLELEQEFRDHGETQFAEYHHKRKPRKRKNGRRGPTAFEKKKPDIFRSYLHQEMRGSYGWAKQIDFLHQGTIPEEMAWSLKKRMQRALAVHPKRCEKCHPQIWL